MTSFVPIDSNNLDTHVQIGTTAENKWLEFKTAYSKDLLELARDIAQFANTEGGTLLFGVREEKDPTGKLNIAKDFVDVPDVDALKQAIDRAIQNHITPSTFRPVIETIRRPDGKVVVALNVPPSRQVIYVCKREDQAFEKCQKHLIECLHRTNHGKDWMNPDELERHLMNGSRAAKLGFWEAKKKAVAINSKDPPWLEIVGGVWVYSQNKDLLRRHEAFRGRLKAEYDDSIEVEGTSELLATVTVPYDLIRSTWVDRAGMMFLMLSARIIFIRGGLFLEPL